MKAQIFILSLFLILISCKNDGQKPTAEDWTCISNRVQMKESGGIFELKSGSFSYKIPYSKLPFKNVVFLNASLIGYAAELGAEDRIAGVSSPEYIYSEKILTLIKLGKIQNVGNEQKYNVEKILALKPDAVLTNRIESFQNTYDLLKKNGIEVIFLDEYLEQNPLEKMEYLRVFGKFFGMDKAAAEKSGEIRSEYGRLTKLASQQSHQPLILANEMYGSQWYMPGGKTFMANYIKDAGGRYILSENNEQKAVPLSFEEVYAKAGQAEYWVNVGNHHARAELLQINPNYAKLQVYQKGKLYTVTAREKAKANDYFESGVVRADLVLKDYIKIFHPELLPGYRLTYMRELR